MKLHPDFIAMLIEHFKEEKASEIINAYQLKAVHGIKLNTTKKVVLPFETTPSKLNPDILIPSNYSEAVVHPFHHAGCYYIQDPSATLPIKALNPKEDDLVLDMCAAPGGKSTQILNALTTGFLIANEKETPRLAKLIGNVERWGQEHCAIVHHDGRDLPQYFANTFDKVVLDAPCSGEGLYRRYKDHAMTYNMKTIRELQALQEELLEAAYKCAVDGGELVYATCTLNPYENEAVVDSFLRAHPECSLMDHGLDNAEMGIDMKQAARFFPSQDGEGHFVAKIKVKKKEARQPLKFKPFKPVTKTFNKIEFKGDFKLQKDLWSGLSERGRLITDANCVYDGAVIAVEKKGRTEFTQGLAYHPQFHPMIPKIALDLDDAYKYLYGLSLENHSGGYALVSYQNQALGFVKGGNNKYPKSLRNRFVKYSH